MTDRNNHYRAIVFDFGGVLVDWSPYHLYRKLMNGDDQAIGKFLDEIGFEEWNLALDGGRPFAQAIADLSQRFPQYADLIRAFDQRWAETVSSPIEATVNLLPILKHAGFRLYGLSNCSYEKYLVLRSTYAFFELLEHSVISGQVKLLKPDPRIFDLLLERIGHTAGECVFIDDAVENTDMARQLGLNAIHYQGAAELQIELARLGILP